MAIEYELKFRTSAAAQAKIRQAFPGEYAQIQMRTVYYDTPAGDLSARRWTLRCRQENDTFLCTLKTPAPGGGRGEWETECEDILRAIPILSAASGLTELEELTARGLVQTCGARFTRHATMLVLEGCTAELALDEGVLQGGSRETPLREAELELKSGDAAALEAFGTEFQRRFGLETEKKSKFARAKALAQEV